MRPIFRRLQIVILLTMILSHLEAQVCSPVTISYDISESRCVATGSVGITAAGGSGNYQYKVTGPINTVFSPQSTISGLLPGRYLVTVLDINTNCVYANDSITITGTYQTPAFSLVSTRTTCANTPDGSITLTSQQFGRAPFSYKIIAPSASGVGSVNVTGNFTGLIAGSYLIQLSDSCGALQTRSIQVPVFGWKINLFSAFKTCDTLNISIGLKDDDGNLTPSTAFSGFQYGVVGAAGDTIWFSATDFKYTLNHSRFVQILVKSPCGVIKKESWNEFEFPALAANASVNNIACGNFTISVSGQVNLSANTQYCLYNSQNISIACNSIGIFTNVNYGSYCIKAMDPCYDTIITRCVNVQRLVPAVDATVNVNLSCLNASVLITGQVNLSNPTYCLYNSSNTMLACNSTGSFSNIPFGNYCIKISNNPICYDTVITRCFSVLKPVPAAPVVISNQTCTGFTATVNTAKVATSQFCLYTSPTYNLVQCNSTGVFDNLSFGSYCIELVHTTICGDTVLNSCFTVLRPLPSVSNNVILSANDCPPFTAAISGQVGLNNPQYCLYNNNNLLIECNNTGLFTIIQNGSYCIKIKNDPACYDTTITRCFTKTGLPVAINALSTPSCTLIGGTDILVNITSGVPTYSLAIYAPSGALVASAVTSGTKKDFTFLGVPTLPAPIQYKIVVTDLCGNKDSLNITPVISFLNKTVSVATKCPTGSMPNGSSDIVVNYVVNNIGGQIRSDIIRQNGVPVSIAGTRSGPNNYVSTFSNLAPGIYVINTNIKVCNNDMLDTVVIKPYVSPNLLKSTVFRCDDNSLSVGAAVTNGVGPFQYEILSSTPATPSIITPPQSTPLFTINNSTNYSLIRLRVVDACGNAGLNDIGIVPLGAVSISAGYDCYYVKMVLKADSIPNTSYKWYKKTSPTDSIFIGTGANYTIPYLMPADTGNYVSVFSINSGCITRVAKFHVEAGCIGLLQQQIALKGSINNRGDVELNWLISSTNSLTKFEIERSDKSNGSFSYVGMLTAEKSTLRSYSFIDRLLTEGTNFYRLKIYNSDQSFYYSNIVALRKQPESVAIYPNPVYNDLIVRFQQSSGDYQIILTDLAGSKILEKRSFHKKEEILHQVAVSHSLKAGVYIIVIKDNQTAKATTRKIVIR